MHKIGDWETTLVLFEYEYQVPFLNFELAAYLATFGELVFPVFLIAGLGTRYIAIALSLVNIIAVVSYYATLAKGAFPREELLTRMGELLDWSWKGSMERHRSTYWNRSCPGITCYWHGNG